MRTLRWLPALALVLALATCGAGGDDSSEPTAATGTDGGPVVSTGERPSASDGPSAQAAARTRLALVGRFNSPVYVAAPSGDRSRIFVVEQEGRIHLVRNGRRLPRPFLDISGQVLCCGEQGLFAMAFPRDYARSGRFYVHFSDRAGDNRIVEYRRSARDPNRALAGSRRLLLRVPGLESNHNGGQIQIGPDGMLYIGLGDGGGGDDQHGQRGNAQSLSSPLGKILRIDPRPAAGRPYRIPPGNPFARRAGARREIYSYGLRNPWRFSFDRLTGDLTIGDVGQNAFEEIDFVRRGRGAGANFGWRPWEGNRRNFDEPAPGHIRPVLTYGRGRGCSVTGGYVVRDRGLGPLYGRYVYGDFCAGVIRSARLGPGSARDDRSTGVRVANLSSFGEDARGRVYATSLSGGVFRLTRR